MSTRTARWPAGMPCWADLSAPDVVAAGEFYRRVLGWSIEHQGEEYGHYAIASVDGRAAAGIGPTQDGAPNAWTVYLASDDADATAAAITEHGGTVIAAPFDVGPLGRMLIAADPTGAAFGVWQAGEHIGANVVNEPGALSWDDLRTTDPPAAWAFYAGVFGYDVRPLAEAGPAYSLFHLAGDETPAGGIGAMFGVPEGTPPHWLAYFGVADADTAVAAVEAGGGSVLAPAFDTPYGRMAGVTDPDGAVFWLAQVDLASQPDRSG